MTANVYNVAPLPSRRMNSVSAVKAFSKASITFEPNPRRQGIVDSWPEDVDDSLARTEWNWKPDYDVDRFFDDYFLPEIRKRYGK